MGKRLAQRVGLRVGLVLAVVFAVGPLWSMGYMAFDESITAFPKGFRIWPEDFGFSLFVEIWEAPMAWAPSFLRVLGTTFMVAGTAAVVAVVVGASMAYAFAKLRFPGRSGGLFVVLLGALLPPVALLTPLFVLLRDFGVESSNIGLIIVYTGFTLPLAVWIMRSSFVTVPRDLSEAAYLDGANEFQVFRKVALPLALPTISVAALLSFLVGYSEFAMGWLIVQSNSDATLAMVAWAALFENAPWGRVAALAILMSLPVVGVFLMLHRVLIHGWSFGTISSD